MTSVATSTGSAAGAGTAVTVQQTVSRQDAMRSRAIYAVVLVEVYTSTDVIRAWDGLGRLKTPDGRKWDGTQTLGAVSSVEAGERFESRTFTVGFHIQQAAVGEDAFADLMSKLRTTYETDIRGRPVRVYVGIYDETGTLIENTLTLWASGVGSHFNREVSREAITLSLAVANALDQGFPGRSLFLTDADQKDISSGDTFLEFVSVIASSSRNVTWSPTY